jgi:hypothetical protein
VKPKGFLYLQRYGCIFNIKISAMPEKNFTLSLQDGTFIQRRLLSPTNWPGGWRLHP